MNTTQRQLNKAFKLALLAISEDNLQNDEAANAAGLRAGQLTKTAGYSVKDLWEALLPEGITKAHVAWCSMVDGWHAA